MQPGSSEVLDSAVRGAGGIAVAAAVWAAGALATGLGFHVVRTWEADRAGRSLELLAVSQAAHVSVGLTRQIEGLYSIGGLFDASEVVDPGEFRTFCLGIRERHRAVRTLAWAPRMHDGHDPRKLAELGAPDLAVVDLDGKPVPAGRPCTPLVFVEPDGVLSGLDLASEPELSAHLVEVRDSGQLRLVRGELFGAAQAERAFCLYPVYDPPRPLSRTVREATLQGFVVGAISVEELLGEVLLQSDEGLVRVTDTRGAEERVLYEQEGFVPSELMHEQEVSVGGLELTVACAPSADALRYARTWRPWGVLIGGLIISSALAMTVASQTSKRRIRDLIEKRTEQIERANRSLVEEIVEHVELAKSHKQLEEELRQVIDLVPHMIYARDETGRFLLANEATARAYGTSVEALTQLGTLVSPISADDSAAMDRTDSRVLLSGRSVEVEAEPFVDAEGRRLRLRTLRIPFRMRREGQHAVLCVAIDVTDVAPSFLHLADALEALQEGDGPKALSALLKGMERALPGWHVALYSYDGEHLHLLEAPTLKPELIALITESDVDARTGIAAPVVLSGKRLVVESLHDHPHARDHRFTFVQHGVQSAWAEPLRSRGDLQGVAVLYGKEARVPDQHEQDRARVWLALAGQVVTQLALRDSG